MAIQTVKATINGQIVDLTYNSAADTWEATITAPNRSSYNQEGHYYSVEVMATNVAGTSISVGSEDVTLGESLRLTVKERVKPTVRITSPTAGAFSANNQAPITVQLRDEDSGVDLSSLLFKVDGRPAAYDAVGMVATVVAGGYDLTYTPQTALADGGHALEVTVTDHDGNISDKAAVSWSVDTTPPVLSVSSPTEGFITNQAAVTVEGSTNDTTSSPVVIAILLSGVDQGEVPVQADGGFTKAITLAEGENTILVRATDQAGKTTEVTRLVALDTSAPVFGSVTLVPNPVDAGATYILKVEVSG